MKKRGIPKADESIAMVYIASAESEYNLWVVAENRRKLGQFVLATNDLNLSSDEFLTNYKG